MRVAASVLAVMIALASIGPVHAETSSGIIISEVHPRPTADGREFIELHNNGSASVDLQGWNLTDGINTFTFPQWSLPAGGYVVVWGGGNDSAIGPVWKSNVWNNGGDVVRLHDPAGATVDSMQYGTADVPAPDEGQSLHREGGWASADPTPGQDRDGSTGSASATVDDMPPEVTWTDAPVSAQAGATVGVSFAVDEPNGDPVTWTVAADGIEMANGTTVGEFDITATAPSLAGDWVWTLTAASTDQTVIIDWIIHVVAGAFRITLPSEGIEFPGLEPGAVDVVASGPFTITHQGTDAQTPHLDMSPFQGPGESIPVDGNLRLDIIHDDGSSESVAYTGPLQTLVPLAPGESIQVTLVILQVPEPLPAGDYHSSFTVVA